MPKDLLADEPVDLLADEGQPKPSANGAILDWMTKQSYGRTPIDTARDFAQGAARGVYGAMKMLPDIGSMTPNFKNQTLQNAMHPNMQNAQNNIDQFINKIGTNDQSTGASIAGGIGEMAPYAAAGGASLPGFIAASAAHGAAMTSPDEQNLMGLLPSGKLGGAIKEGAEALGLGTLGKTVPALAKMTGNLINKFQPGKAADSLLEFLGKGAQNAEQNATSLGADLRNGHDMRLAESTIYTNHVLDRAGEDQIYKTVNPLISTSLDRGKQMMDTIDDLKVGPLFDKFKNDPTLSNAHDLQSELGVMIGDLSKNPYKTIDQARQIEEIKHARDTLKQDIMTHLNSIDEIGGTNLAPMYERGSDMYRDNVVPYLSSKKLRDIVRGGQETVKNIHTIFDTPSDKINRFTGKTEIGPINKIMQDMPQGTSDKILFSKIDAMKNKSKVDNLADALESARNKGFSKYFTPETNERLTDMIAKQKKLNAAKYIGRALGTGTIVGSGIEFGRKLLNGINNMSGLDPRFVVTSDLEEIFLDKDTGLPLAGGVVTFYESLNPNVLKPVYQLTGSAPNFSYAALPNPCILSAVGTFQDAGGDNIVPYYFPYQGTPSDSTGVVDLYYITVYSSGGVLQFTRDGWPNDLGSGNGETGAGLKNFIPNGQFLAHNNDPQVISGAIFNEYPIAQGGWFVKQTTGGTNVYTLTNAFTRITTAIAGLKDFPRYAFNYICTAYNGDAIRDFVIQWPNVNTFSAGNPVGTQDFTFNFAGASNDSNNYVFSVILTYNFGSDSITPPHETVIGSVSLTPSYAYQTINITGFPVPVGTLGTLDDDFVSISLRGPTTTWTVQVTDFQLLEGQVSPVFFNAMTNAEMLDEGVAGWMPTPAADGSDLYLPLILTPGGMKFDHSQIGKVNAAVYPTAQVGELLCDGTGYITANYSTDGIPYSRLFNILYNNGNSYNVPIFGTGLQFATGYISLSNSATLRLVTNNASHVTATSDGASATGFTFVNVTPGLGQVTNTLAYMITSTVVYVIDTTEGNGTVVNGSGSALTFATIVNNGVSYPQNEVGVSSVPAASDYFVSTANSIAYNFWFKNNGAGSSPGGTAIEIDLLSTMTAAEVAQIIQGAMTGGNITDITVGNAASLSGGQYFQFYAGTTNQLYVVWYTNAGVGTQPVVPNSIYIKVALAGAETAAQVAVKTQQAINSYSYAIPDFRGAFLRGLPGDGLFDISANERLGIIVPTLGNQLGSFEMDAFQSHLHPLIFATSFTINEIAYNTTSVTNMSLAATGGANMHLDALPTVGATGNNETRPVNFAVNWMIKY